MENRTRTREHRIQQHLESALAEKDGKEKNRYIRESLQLLEATVSNED